MDICTDPVGAGEYYLKYNTFFADISNIAEYSVLRVYVLTLKVLAQ